MQVIDPRLQIKTCKIKTCKDQEKLHPLGKLLEMWQICPLSKEYQNNTTTANQDQTMVTTFKNTQNGPTYLQTIEPIRYPTAISPARPPILA